MSKHTKGPWTFSAADKMNPDRAYGIIAHDDAEGPDGDATQCVAEVCISGDDEIARADAALIAAAPDLLEACKEAAAWLESGANGDAWALAPAKTLRAAIARAEGRA